MSENSALALRRTIAPHTASDSADVLVTKRSLQRLGHFHDPVNALNDNPNLALSSAIKSFQTDRGLRVDGVMNPDGETAREIGRLLANQPPSEFAHTVSAKNGLPSEEDCDYLYWNVDIPTCNAIRMRRGNEAAARCYHTATLRYAVCLRGLTPIDQLPPLDTYD